MKSYTHTRNLVRLGLVALVVTLGSHAIAEVGLGGPTKSAEVVSIEAKASKPNDKGKQKVTFEIKIEEGYHLYANPVGNQGLKQAQTTVTLRKQESAILQKVNYPEGKLKLDDIVGNYRVYENKVTIEAEVKRANGDTSPLEFVFNLQACTDMRCLQLSSVKVQAK